MNIFLAFALFLFNVAFAKTPLLEALQRGNLYDQSCRSELASLSSKDFESNEIQRYKKPIKDFPLYLGEFYHYTKMDLSHFSNSEILSYSLLQNDNLAGGGLYVSANPMTSRSYGNVLNKFTVSAQASFVDLSDLNVSKIVADFLDRHFKEHACPTKVLQTIFYQSNDIDLIWFEPHENTDLDWFVFLNDDIILSRSEHIFSSSDMSSHVQLSIGPTGVTRTTVSEVSPEAICQVEPSFVERYLNFYAHQEELSSSWLSSRFEWFGLSYETQKTLIAKLPFNQRLLDATIYLASTREGEDPKKFSEMAIVFDSNYEKMSPGFLLELRHILSQNPNLILKDHYRARELQSFVGLNGLVDRVWLVKKREDHFCGMSQFNGNRDRLIIDDIIQSEEDVDKKKTLQDIASKFCKLKD